MFENVGLGLLGACFGMVIAVGAASLAAAIGIYPRLLAKAKGAGYILFAESVAMLGILVGTVVSVFPVRAPGGGILLPVGGLFAGVYVGCLLMALAEILQAFPVMFRRFRLKNGLSLMVGILAFGKLCGSLYYFAMGIGK